MYTLTGYLSPCCYRPPMKLREGNVFSRICLSVILFTVGITYDALDLDPGRAPIGHVQTC